MDWLDTALWIGLKLFIGSITLAACVGTVLFFFALCATGVLRLARKHQINTMWMTSAFLSAFMFACGLGYGVLQHQRYLKEAMDILTLVGNLVVLFVTVLLFGAAGTFLVSVLVRLGLMFGLVAYDAVRFLCTLRANSIWMTGTCLSAFMFLCGIGYGVFQHQSFRSLKMLLLRLVQIPILGYIAVLFLFIPYSIWRAQPVLVGFLKNRISSLWMMAACLSVFMFLCGIGYGVFQLGATLQVSNSASSLEPMIHYCLSSTTRAGWCPILLGILIFWCVVRLTVALGLTSAAKARRLNSLDDRRLHLFCHVFLRCNLWLLPTIH